MITQRLRATMITELFMRRRTTVARPIAVIPSTLAPSGLQAKRSDHLCVRGLNRDAISPVKGSIASVEPPLNSLHERQAKQTFPKVVSPPLETGRTVSYTHLTLPTIYSV